MKEQAMNYLIDSIAMKYGTLLNIDELRRVLKEFPEADESMVGSIYKLYREKYPDHRYPDEDLNWEYL